MQTLSCTGPYIKSCKSPLDGDEIRAIMFYDGYAMEKTNVFFTSGYVNYVMTSSSDF